MNYTTAVFLINTSVRAIMATYEAADNAPRTLFKTLDPELKEGDFVIVPTDTRHKMTVCKVVEVDVDFDIEASTPVHWVIGKVDREAFDETLKQEAIAIQKIKAAELRKKREDLASGLLANHVDELKSLKIAQIGDQKEPASAQ